MLIKKEKRNNKKIIIFSVTAIAVILLLSFISENFWNTLFRKTGLKPELYKSAELSVHFVDVGQGDCTVITTKDGKSAIIDSGDEIHSGSVIDYIRSLNIERFDYCIVTHPHSDHCAGMSRILGEIPAETAVMTEWEDENALKDEFYIKYTKAVNENCKHIVKAKAGDEFSLGEVKIKILAPVKKIAEVNSMSLVIKIIYNNYSFIVTGDCTDDEEKIIINKYKPDELRCNVLRAGHHGSETSTSDEWLDILKPEYCVISVGKNNQYNFPSTEMIERLYSRNISYYRTDISSTVVFDCDNNNVKIRSLKT